MHLIPLSSFWGVLYLEAMEKELEDLHLGRIISVIGRYLSLDWGKTGTGSRRPAGCWCMEKEKKCGIHIDKVSESR